jgi:hypothetical protein
MKVARLMLAAGVFLASFISCYADPTPVIHYAPAENLEHIDVALIDGARHEIDMAAHRDRGGCLRRWGRTMRFLSSVFAFALPA